MRTTVLIGIACIAALAVAGVDPTSAQPSRVALWELAAKAGISLQEAIRKVRSVAKGRVVGAEVVDEGRRYRIRVLGKDGRVKTYYVDAKSGRIG